MTDAVIILGSISDRDVARKASDIFAKFGIVYTIRVTPAHRTPARVLENHRRRIQWRCQGLHHHRRDCAHIPGVVASYTTKPVIGVPVNTALDGISVPRSMAQAPSGIPAVYAGIGRGDNTAILAVRIMAAEDQELAGKPEEHRRELTEETELMINV